MPIGPTAPRVFNAEGLSLNRVERLRSNCRHRGILLAEAKRGFVLLPRRWVVERSFAWATRCRRLVKDYKRYDTTLAGLLVIAFVCFMLKQAAILAAGS